MGFGLSALAGFSGALVTDNFNRERKRRIAGWFLLLLCLPLLVLCFLLGLP